LRRFKHASGVSAIQLLTYHRGAANGRFGPA
jgi:hypothetical protein